MKRQIRVALFGGPGAGKTTLANAFAAAVKDRGVQFYAVNEYAREFIDLYGPNAIKECGPLIQQKIHKKQCAREDQISDSVAGFVTDSPTFLSWIYSAFYGDNGVASYITRKDMYKSFLSETPNYTHIVRVAREKPYLKDGTRAQSEEEAVFLDQVIEMTLKMHRVPYIVVTGTTEERVQTLLKAVSDDLDQWTKCP